jgi:general secretion pathway protein G
VVKGYILLSARIVAMNGKSLRCGHAAEMVAPPVHHRRTKLLRYLRIAFSVTCGIACVLLIVKYTLSESFLKVIDYPIWASVLAFASFASISNLLPNWMPRFSLRTLLIAMTLVAVVLGVIVLLSPKPKGDDNARANENAAAGQVGSYSWGLDSYHTDVKKYPHTLKALSASAITGWHGPYTRGFAKDPWGHDWMYVAPGKHNPDSYDIWSVGPDGVDGTADDIGNWESK